MDEETGSQGRDLGKKKTLGRGTKIHCSHLGGSKEVGIQYPRRWEASFFGLLRDILKRWYGKL